MKTTSSVAFTFISGLVFICHLWSTVSCHLPPKECSDPYPEYKDSSRSSENFVPDVQDLRPCSKNLWYRFNNFTNGTKPGSCVDIFYCNKTFLPIWMDTTKLPKNVAQKNQSLYREHFKICAPLRLGNGSCCQWSGHISVLFCSRSKEKYLIYQLKGSPSCSESYCAANEVRHNNCPCGTTSTSSEKSTTTTTTTSSPSIESLGYPKMTGAPELKQPRVIYGKQKVKDRHGTKFFPTRFIVDCVVNYPRQTVDDGARFDVVFEVDGQRLTHYTVSSTNPVATLDEYFLIGHLGKNLTCKVSSHWESSKVRSPHLSSKGRWFGLQPIDSKNTVVSSNLVVKEGERVSLWLQSTFPITTRPCFDLTSEQPCPYSSYSLGVQASKDVLKLTDCAMIFHPNSSRSVELQISPSRTVGNKPKPDIWQLNFETYSDTMMNLQISHELRQQLTPIFKDYRIQSVNIEVRDGGEPPQCISEGDPHIKTFKGHLYNIFGIGDFYLVRLNSSRLPKDQSRLLEIQTRQIRCGVRKYNYSCNCGVMAREGNSIIGITKCDKTAAPVLVEYKLDRDSPSGTIHTIGLNKGWKISLLSGIVITVTGKYKKYMDVTVTGLSHEVDHYDGLCSANVPSTRRCTLDCERYRVLDGQSFFNLRQGNLLKCGDKPVVPTCNCTGKDANRTRTGDSIKITCDHPTGDYLLKINLMNACKRHKRDANDEYDDYSTYDDLISLDEFNNNPISVPNSTEDGGPMGRRDDRFDENRRSESSGAGPEMDDGESILSQLRSLDSRPDSVALSEEDGRRRCTEALTLSFAYDLCYSRVGTAHIIDICAEDVQLLNDYSPTEMVPTKLEIACLDNIRRSLESLASTEVRRFQELKNLLTRVENLVCPSQCNQNGRCVNGTCQCNSGYMGTDCSLRRGQIPRVLRIFAPVCDIRKHPCRHIRLVATDLTNPEDVTCKIRSVSGSFGAVPEIQYATPVISGGLVECMLPSMPISRNNTNSVVYMVQVSISNDGLSYSQELPYTVFDGRCMLCFASQDSPCQIKENTCAIEERCYRAGDRCSADETRKCDPAKCRTKWTNERSVNCNDGFDICP